MPYKSEAQRKFMHANHPDIAARWDKEYPDQKGLPEHVPHHEASKRRKEKKAFWLGFCEKCASLKVNPLELVKISKETKETKEDDSLYRQSKPGWFSDLPRKAFLPGYL